MNVTASTLAEFSLLAGLDDPVLLSIAADTTEHTFEPEEIVARAGEPCRYVFLVVRGLEVIDRHYWKRTIPGDVIRYVKDRIEEHLARHPYNDPADLTPGRRRLDFCGASHYEKILLKNWPQFEPFFGRKDELQRHMAAYRALRNCVQHNREPTEVERKSGEAAILWLEGIIEKYEQEKGRL